MYVKKKINSRQSITVLMERNIGTHGKEIAIAITAIPPIKKES
jgi:hypothetical protein